MNLLRSLAALCLVLAPLSCKSLLKKRLPVEAESASAAASAAPSAAPSALASATPPPSASAAPVANADDQVPTSEDFEDEAFEKVTKATLKTELSRLTKEIATTK